MHGVPWGPEKRHCDQTGLWVSSAEERLQLEAGGRGEEPGAHDDKEAQSSQMGFPGVLGERGPRECWRDE